MTVGKDAVLVLGGGIYQIPLIERSKARNLKAVVASIPGNYPGIALADEFLPSIPPTSKESSLPRAARMPQQSLPTVPMSRFVPSAPRSTPWVLPGPPFPWPHAPPTKQI